jgi:hypothetical protein
MIKSYSLSEDDVEYIIQLPEVIHAKEKLDLLSNNGRGRIDFYIDIPASLKRKIGNEMGINLSRMENIPMRWIKGDTARHNDVCIKDFSNTYLAYLTNSEGRFIVDGNVYAIAKGNAYVFSEGLQHETSGTGLEPRLLLGPMSEDGNSVGPGDPDPPLPPPPPVPVREYDQILSGDVKIEKVSSDHYTHKITFSKKNIADVITYQVWSDSSPELNNNRIVKEVKATKWVKEAFRKVANVVPFTPTAVMELDDGECPVHHKCNKHAECRHVFVINRALVNKCDQVVFYVSSKDIVLPSIVNKELKLLKTIPTGPFRRVRFDLS